jgi:hypothetical protein
MTMGIAEASVQWPTFVMNLLKWQSSVKYI